jgi:hypothetical protein
VSRDFVELLLFGNLGRRAVGSPPFQGDSSGADGWAGATAAFAMGLPIPVPVGHLAVGATLKLTQGLVIGGVRDLGSSLQTNPFVGEVRVHYLHTSPDSSWANGMGFGADLGVAYDLASGMRLGLAIENLFSTMSWSNDGLLYGRREYRLAQLGGAYVDSVISEIESSPFNEADPVQAALRDSVLGRATFGASGGARSSWGQCAAGDAMLRIDAGSCSGRASAPRRPLSVMAFRGGLRLPKGGHLRWGWGSVQAVRPRTDN